MHRFGADLSRLRNARTLRASSWDPTGRNRDNWIIPPGESRVLADLSGPGCITHIWTAQPARFRRCVLRFTWDDGPSPSVLAPVGDFFCLGHELVNSFQNALFSGSTNRPNQFNVGVGLNCYVPMPFRRRALLEIVNESDEPHPMWFYVDYERHDEPPAEDVGYFHAEFRRTCPFGGWGPEILVNTPQADAPNEKEIAWRNNYVILDTQGRGHYIGCNLSVTNFQGTWWGEGDDMIWVDGYHWPPDLHGTGSEDYLGHAWGMQANAFLRNGTSLHEAHTGGYQTSYVLHLENPVHFREQIKVTIEHGHANHLANEMSSTAYWYAAAPTRVAPLPPVAKRLPVPRDNQGRWLHDRKRQCPGAPVEVTPEMEAMKASWAKLHPTLPPVEAKWFSPFLRCWRISELRPRPRGGVRNAPPVGLGDATLGWQPLPADTAGFVNVHDAVALQDGVVYLATRVRVDRAGTWNLHVGHDGGVRAFLDGREVLCTEGTVNPAPTLRSQAPMDLHPGEHEIVIALDTDQGRGWGVFARLEIPPGHRKGKAAFPAEPLCDTRAGKE